MIYLFQIHQLSKQEQAEPGGFAARDQETGDRPEPGHGNLQ